MEKNILEISRGNTVLIRGYNYGNPTVVISSNEGWYDTLVDIQTVPKMLGHGSYIISEQVAEKVIIAIFSVKGPISVARKYWTDITNVMLSNNKTITVKNTITNGATTTTETLTGNIRSIKPKPAANESTIEVEIVCPNPTMK